MRFSIITPVYNRPQEVRELLETLANLRFRDFELVLVEDGSTEPCRHIVDEFSNKVQIQYHFKAKEGPSLARNFGFEQAKGEYLILFDSDLLIPPDYFEQVTKALANYDWDAFGGPDRAHESFSDLQKAVNYAMTSLLTTGGIRGNTRTLAQYTPRSFNMGLSRKVYETVGGFINMHPGEDIDFSIRIQKSGFRVGFIPNAFVYHKRRATWSKFWRQMFRFGQKRVELARLHPGQLKLAHLFPVGFLVLSLVMLPALATGWPGAWVPICIWTIYLALIFVDSSRVNRSPRVGLLSVYASLIQLYAYAFGLIDGFFTSKRKASSHKTS
jgi:glycosyltransferase involved in cell wall biosynthesis